MDSDELKPKTVDLQSYLEEFAKDPVERHDYASGPASVYSKHGDCLFVHFADTPYYAEWVNHDLTLYREFNTKRVVGLQLSGHALRGLWTGRQAEEGDRG
jgi:hypothetical protein